MSGDSKTSFELEPNPFERSFATKESTSSSVSNESKNPEKSIPHSLNIPTLASIEQSNGKLPGITPTIFTPGGRRLPPLGISPGGNLANPETPGINLWNSLLSATNNNTSARPAETGETSLNSHNSQVFQLNNVNNHNNFNQFLNNLRKTGLTPNESNLRSGLTPGGINNQAFQFSSQVPGLNTPGTLLNGGSMPGLNLMAINGPPSSSGISQSMHNSASHIPVATSYKVSNEPLSTHPEEEKSVVNKKSPTKRIANIGEEKSKKQKMDTAKSKPLSNGKSKSDSSENKGEKSKNELEEEKRKNFLERNRVAASKCRQRKKQLVQKMEDELNFYSTGYRELSSQVTQLRDQLITLKGIIVGHKDCPMLASSVGGFDHLHNLIQQINYVTQMTSKTQNITTIPSTIPTTLNNPHDDVQNMGFQVVSNHNIAPVLPIHMNNLNQSDSRISPSNSSDSISNTRVKFATQNPEKSLQSEQSQQQENHIEQQNQIQTSQTQSHNQSTHNLMSSHHSMTDLPAAAVTAENFSHDTQGGNGDLRLIHSMSNLAAMNKNPNNTSQSPSGINSYNLKQASSMIDLHSQQVQSQFPSNYGNDVNILGMNRSSS